MMGRPLRRLLCPLLALVLLMRPAAPEVHVALDCESVPSVRLSGVGEGLPGSSCCGVFDFRGHDEDTGRPFYARRDIGGQEMGKRMFLAFVAPMGLWAVSAAPGSPPFCASVAGSLRARNPVDDAAGKWTVWHKGSDGRQDGSKVAPGMRAAQECREATPAPTPLELVTFSPTPTPTPPPTPAPTPPMPESLCPTVLVLGKSIAKWVPAWCRGAFGMNAHQLARPQYGGLPVYTRNTAKGSCNIYYSMASQMWIMGGPIGQPPFFIFAKVLEPAVEWAPWRIEQGWSAYDRSTRAFVKLPDVMVRCVKKTPSPTPAPTPVPTPSPTPVARVSHKLWCRRLLLSSRTLGLEHYTGWFELTHGHKGRPIYSHTVTVAGEQRSLQLYFDPSYRQWVVSARIYEPPFFLLAKSAAAVPERIPSPAWQHYDGLSYHALEDASMTCPASTQMPTPSPTPKLKLGTPSPTPAPTPSPTPPMWALCRYVALRNAPSPQLRGVFGLRHKKVAGKPAYALLDPQGSALLWLYFRAHTRQSRGAWVVSQTLHNPPWLLVARSEAFVPYDLGRTERWGQLLPGQGFVTMDKVRAHCSAPPNKKLSGGGVDKFVWARGPVESSLPNLCRNLRLSGAGLGQPGHEWMGDYALQTTGYADKPRYWSDKTLAQLYYRPQYAEWVLGGHTLSLPPFYLVVASTAESPFKITGTWAAFSHSTGDYSDAPWIKITCAAVPHAMTVGPTPVPWQPTPSPTWQPTPMPTPAPTPLPTATCTRILMSGGMHAGWYSASTKQPDGRRQYVSATGMHLYFRLSNRVWAVSRDVGIPPFDLVARSSAVEPMALDWEVLDSGASGLESYHVTKHVQTSCPYPTPVPTPVPTLMPTPVPPPHTYDACARLPCAADATTFSARAQTRFSAAVAAALRLPSARDVRVASIRDIRLETAGRRAAARLVCFAVLEPGTASVPLQGAALVQHLRSPVFASALAHQLRAHGIASAEGQVVLLAAEELPPDSPGALTEAKRLGTLSESITVPLVASDRWVLPAQLIPTKRHSLPVPGTVGSARVDTHRRVATVAACAIVALAAVLFRRSESADAITDAHDVAERTRLTSPDASQEMGGLGSTFTNAGEAFNLDGRRQTATVIGFVDVEDDGMMRGMGIAASGLDEPYSPE